MGLADILGGAANYLRAGVGLSDSGAQGMGGDDFASYVQNTLPSYGSSSGGGNTLPAYGSSTYSQGGLPAYGSHMDIPSFGSSANPDYRFNLGVSEAQQASYNVRHPEVYEGLKPGQNTGPGSSPLPGPAPSSGPSSGLSAGVARWAQQAQSTFGDMGGDLPDVMLAIMENESGGTPGAYNSAGNAYGLFQIVGFGDGNSSWASDTDGQFAAAKALLRQKLASIDQSYRANGLNPDQRTRARDVALAWAGHFDYATGTLNPNSRDVGSRQTAQQLSDIFLKNYDRIKAGRQQAPTGGGGNYAGSATGVASLFGGQSFPLGQDFNEHDPSLASVYDFGTQFGMDGDGHTGWDISSPVGTNLYMPAGLSGTVSIAGGSGFYRDESGTRNPATSGEIRIALSNGMELILGHNSNINVRVGQQVNAGTLLGQTGWADAPHLHVEVRMRDPSTPSGWRIVNPAVLFGTGAGAGEGP